MPTRGQYTYHEITSQPDAWAEALTVGRSYADTLKALWQQLRATELLFTGCGSTYYLSLAAAALACEAGLPAQAAPASQIWLFPNLAAGRTSHTMLIAVSRSGETSETVRAIDAFRQDGGRAVVAITCYPDSTVARQADLVLAIPGAQEASVAQTRSFASMLVLCQVAIGQLAGDDDVAQRLRVLPDLGRRLIDLYGSLAAGLGGQVAIRRFFFLGNGPCYGLASEAMLKMKEMSLSDSEAYHTLEFRHGPKSMVDQEALVVGLVTDEVRAQESAVLAETKGLGARLLVLDEKDDIGKVINADHRVGLASGLPTKERLVLYLPILQLLAYHRSLAKGLNPDGPRNLTAVVTL
ncbi:MAG: SIS domain-containing protein [Anaerolineae bacterium]|nr:SIS domain-containing protein [Anaerolineae bacterium]